jgi:hypothetical protein
MEVEDEWLLKDLVVIFVFKDALYCSLFLLMSDSFRKKRARATSRFCTGQKSAEYI